MATLIIVSDCSVVLIQSYLTPLHKLVFLGSRILRASSAYVSGANAAGFLENIVTVIIVVFISHQMFEHFAHLVRWIVPHPSRSRPRPRPHSHDEVVVQLALHRGLEISVKIHGDRGSGEKRLWFDALHQLLSDGVHQRASVQPC